MILFYICSCFSIRSSAARSAVPPVLQASPRSTKRPRHLSILVALMLIYGATIPSPAAAADTSASVAPRSVQLRITLMNRQKDALDLLTDMAGGRRMFDAKLARAARKTLMKSTRQLPRAFADQLIHPQSHALPGIWYNWADFEARADTANTAAKRLSTRSLNRLRQSLPAMMNSCISCHTRYRARANEFTTH